MIFEVGTFKDNREEMMPLIEAHNKEVEDYELDLDLDLYDKLEDMGLYIVILAKVDGKIVGYNSFFVQPHMHWKYRTIAMADGFYLHPDHRKGWSAIKMFRFTEAELVMRGATDIWAQAKDNTSALGMLEYLGYENKETTYGKRIV